jgi:predicted CxxxxCH...CXXCH cytochrome family protein
MKKFYMLTLALLVGHYSYTNSGGSPGGRSGSPASNGQTCMSSYCHSGGTANGNEFIDINVDVVPNSSSTVFSDTIRDSIDTRVWVEVSAAGSSKIGFAASIEDASGNHIGTLSAPSSGNTKLTSTHYVTHKSSSTAVTNDERSWSWEWNTGDIEDSVTIYVAVNYTNSNGNTSGDYVVTAQKTLYPGLVMNSGEDQLQSALNIYPNPASDYISIEAKGMLSASLMSLDGRFANVIQSVDAQSDEVKMDVSSLPRGTYMLMAIYVDGKARYKHIVLQ